MENLQGLDNVIIALAAYFLGFFLGYLVGKGKKE